MPTSGRTESVTVQLALGLRTFQLVDGDAELQRRFAYALNAAMEAKGWKAPDLAKAIGRDASTIDRWANGKSIPNLFTVKPVADALGVKPELLFDPPPVPDYPLSEYLVRQAAAEGVEQGIRQSRRRRAS